MPEPTGPSTSTPIDRSSFIAPVNLPNRTSAKISDAPGIKVTEPRASGFWDTIRSGGFTAAGRITVYDINRPRLEAEKSAISGYTTFAFNLGNSKLIERREGLQRNTPAYPLVHGIQNAPAAKMETLTRLVSGELPDVRKIFSRTHLLVTIVQHRHLINWSAVAEEGLKAKMEGPFAPVKAIIAIRTFDKNNLDSTAQDMYRHAKANTLSSGASFLTGITVGRGMKVAASTFRASGGVHAIALASAFRFAGCLSTSLSVAGLAYNLEKAEKYLNSKGAGAEIRRQIAVHTDKNQATPQGD